MVSVGKNIGIECALLGTSVNQYEPETILYLSGLTTAVSAAQKYNIDLFVKEVKTGFGVTSLTSIFDLLYLWFNETEELSLRNLVKRQFDCTKVSTPYFDVYGGWRGKDTSPKGHLKTGFNPSIHAVALSRNSVHLAVQSNTELQENLAAFGGLISASGVFMMLRGVGANADQTIFRTNCGSIVKTATTSSIGFFVTSRTTSALSKLYINGVESYSSSLASVAIDNVEMFGLTRCNDQGLYQTGCSIKQYGFASVGRGLSAAEEVILRTAYNSYVARANQQDGMLAESGTLLLTEENTPINA